MAKGHSNNTPRSSARSKRFWTMLSRIGIVLLILIPTYLAILGYFLVKNAPNEIEQTYYTEVEIESPSGFKASGKPLSGDEAKNDSSTLFDTFVLMLEGAVYSPHIPKETHPWQYRVTMTTNTQKEHYTFYFSPDDTAAYFENEAGAQYRTEDTAAKSFLNGPFAFEIYESATPPVLTTAATDEITPSSMKWSYQTQDGTFSDLAQIITVGTKETYPIANDVAFYFSLAPTSCHLVIRDGDEILYDANALDGISLPLTQGKTLDFEIEAVWAQSSTNSYYGNAVYRFHMVVVEAASFSLNAAESQFGNYFLLTCHNLRNEQKLVITGEPALSVAPIVFRRDDLVYAIIPADLIGSRHITATYGTVSSSFDTTVTTRASVKTHALAPAQLRGDWSTLSADLDSMIRQKGASTVANTQFYPQGSFGLPVKGATASLGFGDLLTLSGSRADITLPFEYYQSQGAVFALSHGRVLECGEDALLGKYVIVDHGCGLYSWYCGLSAIYKSVGDAVAVGDALGATGQTGPGLANTDGVLLLTTWGQSAIAPQYLREQSILIP